MLFILQFHRIVLRVGPLWVSIGCFVSNINNFLPLMVHTWKYSFFVDERQLIFSTSWHAKMSLTRNELIKNVLCSNLHTISKHAPILIEDIKCHMQNNQLPLKKSHQVKDNYYLLGYLSILCSTSIHWQVRGLHCCSIILNLTFAVGCMTYLYVLHEKRKSM